MTIRCVLLACLLCAGCVNLDRVNEIAADSMSYSRFSAKTSDPALIDAIRRISASDAHRQLQRVLARLPEDMRGCLIIEAADSSSAPARGTDLIPAIFVAFEGKQSNGFLSNFGFDAQGQFTDADLGWRAAVWPADHTLPTLLPDDPAALLPSAATRPAESSRLVAILTLVTSQRIITVAGWVHDTDDASPGQSITHHPTPQHFLHLLSTRTWQPTR